MIKIGITGNIASGKSCVEEYIKSAGYIVVDCDKINSELLFSDDDTKAEIKDKFKDDDVFSSSGDILKDKLAKVVFSNVSKKKTLETIMHKRINKKLKSIFDENENEKYIFVSAALMFESGFYKDYDKIIFVYAKDDIRLERLIKRNGYTKEYAMMRLKSQQAQEDKVKLADFIIHNDSDLNSLKVQTKEVLEKITNQL